MPHGIRPPKTLLMLNGLVAIMLLILAGIAFGLTELIRPGLGGLERGGPLEDSYHEQEPLQWTPDGRTIIAGISGTIYKIGVDRVELTPIHKYHSNIPPGNNQAHPGRPLHPSGPHPSHGRTRPPEPGNCGLYRA